MPDKLQKIASFQIDHTRLMPGMYTSRVDGDVTTYDLRFVRPNTPPYLETAAMHTIEHLFATYVRSGEYSGRVVYFGPMGCRTGFYFLTRCLPPETVIALTKEALAFIAGFDGEVPGASAVECGNYREHDLPKAREYAAAMLHVLENWTPLRLVYPA
ncbi:MAG TPA: S-ribosylhomocysteine lyase [Firmicutes bacterium]|nr:S-ribosylhomocysteine lyase [Bacillota bacterium]